MRIQLLAPPLGSLTQPTLSLPTLAGYLRSLGHEVSQHDAGIACVDRLLMRERLAALWAQAQKHSVDNPGQARRAKRLVSASLFVDDVIEKIEWAKQVMRSSELFYRPEQYACAVQIINRAFDIVSAASFPTRVSPRNLRHRNGLAFRAILDEGQDEVQNPFLAILRDEILPELLAGSPDIVGISAMYSSQVWNAFTLARLVKQASPGSKVILGGAAVTEAETTLRNEARAFLWVDAYVFGEGEIPLAQYLELVETGGTNAPVSPRLYLAGADNTGESCASGNDLVDFNAVPGPDYAGLNLHDYLAPEIMFPVSNHRGCYYRKCEFCSYAIAFMSQYRSRSAARVEQDVRALQEAHGARFFYFADDAVTPKRCREIATWSRNSTAPFYWNTEIRYEAEFSAETLRELYAGGCRHLSFGNESGNQRVLDLMQKGADLEQNLRILRDAAAAGIAVNLQNFVGFPGETLDEARDTLDMLVENRDCISSFSFGKFSLKELSPIFRKASDFGIADIRLKTSGDLAPDFDFRRANGPSDEALQEFLAAATGTLARNYPCTEIFLDSAYGSHGLLYFQHFGERKLERIFLPDFRLDALSSCVLRLKPEVGIARTNAEIFLYAPHNAEMQTLQAGYAGLLPLLRERTTMHDVLSGFKAMGHTGTAIVEAMEILRALHTGGFLEIYPVQQHE